MRPRVLMPSRLPGRLVLAPELVVRVVALGVVRAIQQGAVVVVAAAVLQMMVTQAVTPLLVRACLAHGFRQDSSVDGPAQLATPALLSCRHRGQLPVVDAAAVADVANAAGARNPGNGGVGAAITARGLLLSGSARVKRSATNKCMLDDGDDG